MTYNELRAAVSAYMHRTDPETIGNEPQALELARVRLARFFFPELASATAGVTFTDNGDGTASAPTPPDFAQADTLYVRGRGDHEWVTPREFNRYAADRTIRNRYTVTGALVLADSSLSAVGIGARMTYYQAPPVIAGTASNWCSTNYPDVWLWQAIAEQQRFVQDAESAALTDAYALELGNAAMQQSRGNREGGALRMTTKR